MLLLIVKKPEVNSHTKVQTPPPTFVHRVTSIEKMIIV